MVNEIGKIIGNALLKGESVCLPDCGTLSVVRHPAARISKKRINPPYKSIVYKEGCGGVSIVDEFVRLGVEAGEAGPIYNEWRREATADGVLTIAGVGVLKDGRFTTDEEFLKKLNPHGTAPVTIKPNTDKFLYIFAVLCCLFAVCVAGYIWYNRTETPTSKLEAPHQESTANEIADVAAVTEEPAAEETATQPEQIVEQPQPAESKPAVNAADKNTVQRTVSGRSYLVLGIFSTEENAFKAVAQAESTYPAADCRVYHYADKFLVSLFEGESVRACTDYRRTVDTYFSDLWIYTKK